MLGQVLLFFYSQFMPKNGRFISNGCILKPHEQKTVFFLLAHGHNIELIPASSQPGIHTADIVIDGITRELKAPLGDSKWTLSRNMKRGRKQSDKIIVDLFRCKRSENKSIRELNSYFSNNKKIKELWIITRSGTIFTYKK